MPEGDHHHDCDKHRGPDRDRSAGNTCRTVRRLPRLKGTWTPRTCRVSGWRSGRVLSSRGPARSRWVPTLCRGLLRVEAFTSPRPFQRRMDSAPPGQPAATRTPGCSSRSGAPVQHWSRSRRRRRSAVAARSWSRAWPGRYETGKDAVPVCLGGLSEGRAPCPQASRRPRPRPDGLTGPRSTVRRTPRSPCSCFSRDFGLLIKL